MFADSNYNLERKMTQRSFKGIVYATISSGTFGLIPLFSIPLMTEGLSTSSILFYRFVVSAIVMGAICVLNGVSLKVSRRSLYSIFLLSTLYAATALLLMYSYNFIPSGIATTIHFLYPILVSIVMITFFKEKRSVIIFIAAVLSLIGVVLLCGTDSAHIKPLGIFIALGTVATYTLYIIGINQSKAGQIKTETLTFYILLFGAILFAIFALFTTGIESIPSLMAFGRILMLAVFATVISDLTLILAIKHVGSTITSILGSMEPLVAVLVGIFYFSEHFSIASFCGIILILASVILVVVRSSKSKTSK